MHPVDLERPPIFELVEGGPCPRGPALPLLSTLAQRPHPKDGSRGAQEALQTPDTRYCKDDIQDGMLIVYLIG